MTMRFLPVTAAITAVFAGSAIVVTGTQSGDSAASQTASADQVLLVTTDVAVPAENAHGDGAVAKPTAAELTTVLHSAVSPDYSRAEREANVERGAEAGEVLDRISSRAGKMMRLVEPRVIEPIEMNGNTATGPVQVTFRGSSGPTTPLRLTFINQDNRWVVSARSVCDVASFNGFECPPGYAD